MPDDITAEVTSEELAKTYAKIKSIPIRVKYEKVGTTTAGSNNSYGDARKVVFLNPSLQEYIIMMLLNL